MKQLRIVILLISPLLCFSQNNSEINAKLNDYIEHLIKRQGIPGVSLAIVKDGETIYEKNFGYANIEHQVPISDESIFRVYSLTKPIVSVGVFQLIEEKKIALDDAVSKYITDLPLSWNGIKIAHLLSHSSGLPDMSPISEFKDLTEEQAKNKVFQQGLKFESGEKYDYNQTGFWILQKIIENVTDESLADFILKNQFYSGKNTFFSSDSRDIVRNRVTPYFPFEKGTLMIDHSYLQGSYAHSKNGLNITLDDFISWDKKLNADKFLNKESKKLMWQSFPFTKSNKSFAYGWDKIMVNNYESYGFSGSLCTAYRVFPENNLSIIFLSNGLTKWYNIDNIINHIASLVDGDVLDINNLAFETVLRTTYENEDFSAKYQTIKNNPIFENNNFEAHLNDVGYFWLFGLSNPKKAINVFELNTKEHPKSWNAFDSLAEAYEKNGNADKAKINYLKAINLNPNEEYKSKTSVKIDNLKG
ncbi:serine hydrolase [Rasiella rasia]|uniref:Serine hydrolase n=1 Tax=Rasiella rasia TaxID=2744027 RepID=A0A6G6GI90_9FLAO|nr:serine hydrolase [Rasiella rasia]QIE58237.1 serine hydrolase [Rasiella rasia]